MDEKSEPDRSFPVLVELAIEGWRFQKLFTKALAKLDPAEAARFVNQHRFFVRKIDDAVAAVGVRFVSIEGEPFDVGAAVTALNLADFGPGEQVVVDQMIEPIVMSQTGLLRTGTVILRKADQ
ncbi:hypothetical protein [Roseiarcus sp.]|uniref:hypothetical protein n=1 Tax=Roseiarcus sp. TaxID=1969460 RepID=UPI003F9C1CA7